MLIWGILMGVLSCVNSESVNKTLPVFVEKNHNYYFARNEASLSPELKKNIKFGSNSITVGASQRSIPLLIASLENRSASWKICRNNDDRCGGGSQRMSICYEAKSNIFGSGNCPPSMCEVSIDSTKPLVTVHSGTQSSPDNVPINGCVQILLSSKEGDEQGRIKISNNENEVDACILLTRALPNDPDYYQLPLIIKHSENNIENCDLSLELIRSSIVIKGTDPSSTSTRTIAPSSTEAFYNTSYSVVTPPSSSSFTLMYVLIGVVISILICVLATAIYLKWTWIKKKFQRKKRVIYPSVPLKSAELQDNQDILDDGAATTTTIKPNLALPEKTVSPKTPAKPKTPKTSDKAVKTAVAPKPKVSTPVPVKVVKESLKAQPTPQPSCSTQPSFSSDKTPPKTLAEMSPDELEFLAWSTPDTGKRYRIFRTAVKLAEKIAESHGFWVHDNDPTVPGDEEEWLKKDADSLVKTCIETHGSSVPPIGATHAEHLEYIKKHSLREIYLVALYTEVNEPTRMFFLNAVIERFREVVNQIPSEELAKGQHPIPLLLRVHKELPEIFGPKQLNNNKNDKNVTKK